MGYRISTIKSLPKDLNCYFFLVGDYRNQSIANDLFREGFNIIADRLGQGNGIIESTDKGHFEWELSKALHDVMESKSELSEYLREFESRIPGLLILRTHPDKLSATDKVIHIPFQVLDSSYSNSTDLLIDLVSYAKGSNNNLIYRIKVIHKVIKGLSFSINVGIFALNIDL